TDERLPVTSDASRASPAPPSVPVATSAVVVAPPRGPNAVTWAAFASPATVCAAPGVGDANTPAAARRTASALHRKDSARRMLDLRVQALRQVSAGGRVSMWVAREAGSRPGACRGRDRRGT